MNELHKHNLKENVLSAIETGKAVMRPRWHFVLRAVFVALGAILAGIATLYVVSFAFFVLRETGALFVPGFGFRGIIAFLLASPWLLLLIAVPFVIVLEVLVRQYSFAYRTPILLTTLGIVALALVGSWGVEEATGVHERFSGYAEDGRLPLVGGLYRRYEVLELEDIHRGVVTEFHDQGFSIENRQEELVVIVGEETRFPGGRSPELGERVVILGEREGDTVHAEGVRPMPGRERGPMRGMPLRVVPPVK